MIDHPRTGLAYLQVRRGRYPADLKIIKATQRMPSVFEADCVVIKVRISIPDSAFNPLDAGLLTVPLESVIIPEVDALNVEETGT